MGAFPFSKTLQLLQKTKFFIFIKKGPNFQKGSLPTLARKKGGQSFFKKKIGNPVKKTFLL